MDRKRMHETMLELLQHDEMYTTEGGETRCLFCDEKYPCLPNRALELIDAKKKSAE
jgi:hypothetical protein